MVFAGDKLVAFIKMTRLSLSGLVCLLLQGLSSGAGKSWAENGVHGSAVEQACCIVLVVCCGVACCCVGVKLGFGESR